MSQRFAAFSSQFAAGLSLAVWFLAAPVLCGQTRAGTPVPQSEDPLIREALAAFQSGELDAAIRKLRQAHEIAPANSYASLYLGLMLYQKNSGSLESQRLMESVLDKFPTNQDLLLRLLDSYLLTGKEAKVPALLERMRRPLESNPRFAFTILYVLVRYGQLDPARRELGRIESRLRGQFREGKEPDPKAPSDQALAREFGEACFIKGMIAASSDQKAEAMRLFQAADRYEFPARDAPQMSMLAEALSRMEEYGLSAQAYEIYLARFPQDHGARLQAGIAHLYNASFARARDQLKQVLEKAPATPMVNYYLGLALVELRQHDEARRHFERELEGNPKSYQAMAQLANLDYLEGENQKCQRWLEKAAGLNPAWEETHFIYGLLYIRLRKYDLAVKSLENVIKQAPQHIKAHYNLSIAYRRSGNEPKAKEHADIYSRLLEAHKARSLGDDPRRK